jgi:hypothetical protein
MTRNLSIGIVMVAAIASVARAQAAREIMDVDVDRAIAEVKRYLYAFQLPEGRWPDPGDPRRAVAYSVPANGSTALAVFALLEGGEEPSDPRLKLGLEALAKIQTENLYILAFRVMALSQVVAQNKDSPLKETLKKDLDWLIRKGGPVSAAQAGAWGYGGPEATGDNSCSQIALLALWEADLAGMEIDSALLTKAEATWVRRQRKDGGWTYPGVPDSQAFSTSSMTAAGLASLFLCRDVLSVASGPYRNQKSLDDGWAFLEKNTDANYINNGYLAFCVQRVGMATGKKFLGPMDWFASGASVLCSPDPQGHRYESYQYGPLVQAAFELIFLARGRIPLTFNKLQYGEEKNWNFHNRDVPRFTEHMRRTFEARMRWQVANIAENVQLMLDAPILLVEGAAAPQFTPEEWAKLREYTLRGGTILFVATGGSKVFADAAKKGLEDLYVEQAKIAGGNRYKLEALGEDHPIYSIYGEKIARGDKLAPCWGVSDGTRMIAIVCQRDIAESWQKRARVSGKLDYQLGTDLYLYATGYNPSRTKMRPVFVGSGKQVGAKVKVAWLAHEGNWYTQPYALDYLSQKLTAENRLALDVQVGATIDAKGLSGCSLAWMTGSAAFKLSDEQVAALRAYVAGGGTLFLNAVGGNKEFRDSAGALLDKLFEGQDVSMREPGPPPNSPLVTGRIGEYRGPALVATQLTRTRTWQQVLADVKGLQLRTYEKDGRVMALFAPYGIHDTLDGHTGYGALSYLPGPAMDIAANIVLYAYAGGTVKPVPASGPAPAAAEAK